MTEEINNDRNFLSRWSHKKLDKESPDQATEKTGLESGQLSGSVEHKLAETEKPIWQQPDVTPEAKKTALNTLFHQPEFNAVDRLNEYDEDFTNFSHLGEIVTQQMKRMIKLAEEKTRPINDKHITDDAHFDQQNLDKQTDLNNDEDNKLA